MGGGLHVLKKERQRQIYRLIEEQRKATVTELADQLNVSQMTIRRDLQDIAAQGAIERVHGGAVTIGKGQLINRMPTLESRDEHADAKWRIGESVAGMVAEGETIFIGAGTTTLAVAEALKNRHNISVVTNALTVANTLASSEGITIMVTGGFLRSTNLSLVGYPGERNLQDIRANKVITGIRGIDPQYGLTSDDIQEMETNLAIMSISKTLIVVADHSKFGRVAASRTAPVSAASMIVTDTQAPSEMVAELRKQGVTVIQV
jgi:DeoR/GlpR family transcriptional regulator of sugar metabolism